jgi:hypothetical protein
MENTALPLRNELLTQKTPKISESEKKLLKAFSFSRKTLSSFLVENESEIDDNRAAFSANNFRRRWKKLAEVV